MISLATALLLFVYLMIVGIATNQAVGLRFGVLRGWLLAPVTGLAVVVISVLLLSQAGIPVRQFALALTLGLLIASSAVLWRRRPILPVKHLWPFWIVFVFGLLYIGWQAIDYGFNWTGYSNADALAYCASASRLIDHGLFETPKLADLLGRDYTQASWFQFGPGMYRCGFDLCLAWAAALTRMNPFAIYMPLMLCLGLVQISGVAALVLTRSRFRRHAMFTCALLSMSPLYGFSVIAQVGPQVGGLGLMLGLCALTLSSNQGGWRSIAKHGASIAVVGLALIVFYPEALAFWGLAYLAFHVASALTGRGKLRFQLQVAAVAAILIAVLGRANLLRGYFTAVFAIQYSKATESGQVVAYTGFEVFWLPHGPAVLFGLLDPQRLPATIWLSSMIVLGFVILVVSLAQLALDAWRGKPYAFVCLSLAAATALVFRSPNAFGLFKMGLYIQPLLIATAAATLGRLPRLGAGAVVAIYFLISFVPHAWAVRASTGALPGLSAAGVNLPPVDGTFLVETDVPNQVPESLLWIYLKGIPQEGLNGRAGVSSQSQWVTTFEKPLIGALNPYDREVAESEVLKDSVVAAYRREQCLGFSFIDPPHGTASRTLLVSVGSQGSHFNGMDQNADGRFFSYRDIASVKNRLVFVNSNKTRDFYLDAIKASYFQLEQDFYRPGKRFYAMGRYFLFEVLNPSEALRVRISLSRTLMGDGRTALPGHGEVLADGNQPLGLVGHGAANMFSPPVHPVTLRGRHYIAIDLGGELISPPNQKRGLMRLYNQRIPIDVRKMIAYSRDISAISEAQYRQIRRPASVVRWPEDLLREPGLEFSGFYEDGWVSDHALMKLGASKPGQHLVIRGLVPGIGALGNGNVLRVTMDGRPAATQSLHPGAFELSIPIRYELDVTSVNLDFSLRENLPKGDDRPIAAQIRELAIR